MPKMVRDLTILIAFCGAFYLLVVFVRGDSKAADNPSNFSIDRLQGDQMIEDGNWKQAIVHFTNIVEKDQYNGLAQVKLSMAEIETLFELVEDFEKKSKSNYYSQAQHKQKWEALEERAHRCMDLQDNLLQFDYYYPIALRNMAQLHCFVGNEDKAIEYATRYVKGGSYLGGPVASDKRMRSLRHRPEFRKLQRLEQSYLPYFDRPLNMY